MNLKELKEIIDIVTSKETIEELEIEKAGVRLRIRRASNHASPAGVSTVVAAAPASQAASPETPEQLPDKLEEELYYVTSPIVGTFYKAPSPTAEAFVSVGGFVEKGSVICIIEAMKLMNEIQAEISGEIVEIYVENGQPVEYGQKLFGVKT